MKLQWLFSALVQPATIAEVTGNPPGTAPGFSWCCEGMPYTVPADQWLGITYVQFGSKFTDGGPNQRASFLTIDNVFALPDNAGEMKPPAPIMVPPGTVLHFKFINNDAEQQWMDGVVQAVLIPYVQGETYRDALARAV